MLLLVGGIGGGGGGGGKVLLGHFSCLTMADGKQEAAVRCH